VPKAPFFLIENASYKIKNTPGDCTAVYKEDVAITIAAGEEFGLPNSFLQISDANFQTKD